MSLLAKIGAGIGVLFGVLLPLISVIWYFAGEKTYAQETREIVVEEAAEQDTLEEIAASLRAIHVRQETVAEGNKQYLAELCAKGVIEDAECATLDR